MNPRQAPSQQTNMNPFLLMAGLGLSNIGSNITAFSLGVWAYKTTGTYETYAFIGMLSTLAIFIFAPIAGYVADRFDRKSILIGTDLLSMSIVVCLGLFYLGHYLSVIGVAFAALGLAISAEFRFTVSGALLHSIASKEQLPRAISVQQISRGISIIGAPLIGAYLIEVMGLSSILIIDCITYVTSIALVTWLFKVSMPPKNQRAKAFWKEMTAGARWIQHSPVHRRLLLIFICFTTAMTLFNISLTPYFLSSGTTADLGIISAALGSGILIAGFVLAGLSIANHLWQLMYGAGFLMATIFVMWGMMDSVLAHCFMIFLIGVTLATLSTSSQTLWQNSTPKELQGKALAFRSSVTYALSPIAILASMPVIASFLSPIISSSNALQWIWGNLSEHAAIGMFISFIGVMLLIMTSYLACKPHQVK
jgi:MFS transporter, DHA3 family, macrolide efflux protein